MKSYRIFGVGVVFSLFICTALYSQEHPPFDVAAYAQFISSHQNMSSQQLLSMYPAGTFSVESKTDYASAKYFDSIDARFSLTSLEKSLLGKHGFVVTQRLRSTSCANAFIQVYNFDLPVFVSTDAILHAVHMSWDAILKDVETEVLNQKLDSLLSGMLNQLPATAAKYSSSPAMSRMLDDIDVYLTVPRMLMGTATGPKNASNVTAVQEILDLINAQQPASVMLFSSQPRTIDFSQFTVRGHYTETPLLRKYFQAMMWLGRTEIYLTSPQSADNQQEFNDIQRQIIDAVLLKELAEGVNAFPLFEDIDGDLRSFVGESDNVTLSNISEIIQEAGITSATQLLDSAMTTLFQKTLAEKSYAFQRINSQILMSDPMSPTQIKPASAFLLLGQRFVIDSYVTGNVVYDRILYNNAKVLRMLPSSLDVLFALGNNAAAQILAPDLESYHYSTNLSALRYLVDSYEPEFWQSTIYDGWLNSIRALNPPANRSSLPSFMQTAAWWQEKMNTQLASWAQLRHDFILYAKQSYSGGTTCSFPESYVEPIPQFFDALGAFAGSAASMFQRPQLQNGKAAWYFGYLKNISDTLGTIAREELSGAPLTESEKTFLKTMLYMVTSGCASYPNGWYSRLFYTGSSGLFKNDLVIADVHTAPTDASGNPIGWVFHVGTGPVNMAVVIADGPDGLPTAYIGPVLSYYEHLSTNFKRLTDEEWTTLYNVAPSLRPSFVNLYLADSTGSALGEGPSLITEVTRPTGTQAIPTTIILGQNYPNPFNSSTIISFSIPLALANSDAELVLYDVQGRLVKRLLSQKLPAGNFTTRWDGTSEGGGTAASGVYFYHLVIGNQRQVGKMSFVK